MTDWADTSLCAAADAIAAGKVTSREILESCLDRTRRLNPLLNAFVDYDLDGAIAAADRADKALKRGCKPGPLHGVPLAHKDMYYRAGRASSCGSRLRADRLQSTTATVLERLDRAGALETGRLVMVEFALGPHGYNANYPLCRNVWNPDHIPCGSSSGSGVAVSAGMIFGSLGSDTGGSIRCPAAVSGVVGIAPTHGRVSRSGVMPMSFSLDVVGPLARRVRDCARLLSVIAGRDNADATTLDAPAPDYEAGLDAPGPLPRIGVARGYFDEGVHPLIASALADAADTFRRCGFVVDEVAMPADDLSEIAELHPLVMKAEGAANHLNEMRANPSGYTPEVRNRLQAGFFIPATDYIQALKLRGTYLRSFACAAFDKADIVMTPVLAAPTPTINDTMNTQGTAYLSMVTRLTRNTKVINYLGLPAISVPCGFTNNGLPVAFQLIGRPLAEAQLLSAAHRYEQEARWYETTPPLARAA
jgi:aspartyl-tRNA(Asn)/glutamyl-tRNA(Gln) amidotransferase subunit A